MERITNPQQKPYGDNTEAYREGKGKPVPFDKRNPRSRTAARAKAHRNSQR